jgi:hypothetical protein
MNFQRTILEKHSTSDWQDAGRDTLHGQVHASSSCYSLVIRSCPEHIKVFTVGGNFGLLWPGEWSRPAYGILRKFPRKGKCGAVVLENAELSGGNWSLRFVVIALKDEQRDVRLVPSATAAFDKCWSAPTPP